MLSTLQSIEVNHVNFPLFLKSFISNIVIYCKKNKRLLTATTIMTLTDREIFQGYEMINEQELTPILKCILQFKGIKFPNGDPALFTAKWIDIITNAVNHYTLYPTPFESDGDIVTHLLIFH